MVILDKKIYDKIPGRQDKALPLENKDRKAKNAVKSTSKAKSIHLLQQGAVQIGRKHTKSTQSHFAIPSVIIKLIKIPLQKFRFMMPLGICKRPSRTLFGMITLR